MDLYPSMRPENSPPSPQPQAGEPSLYSSNYSPLNGNDKKEPTEISIYGKVCKNRTKTGRSFLTVSKDFGAVSKRFGAKKNAETRRNDRASGVLKISITGEQAQFSFRSPSLIQPSLRSISQKRTLSTAGRTKQSSSMAAQSIGVMAALVPAAMSLTQPV